MDFAGKKKVELTEPPRELLNYIDILWKKCFVYVPQTQNTSKESVQGYRIKYKLVFTCIVKWMYFFYNFHLIIHFAFYQ